MISWIGSRTSATAQDRTRALLEDAITASGGENNLGRHSAFAWHGKATIFAGGRTIQIEGEWRIEPPDKASVATYEIEKGPSSLRTMMIDGKRGSMRIAGKEEPLPPELLANERDQFYLYYLMRLVPLRGSDFRLTALASDAEGRPGLRVRQNNRRDAELFFDRAGRLARLVTKIVDSSSGREVVEELLFDGMLEADGIRWPRRIQIQQDGAPFFDMELSNFVTLGRLDLSP